MRNLIVAGVFLTLSLGFVMAEQFQGTIKKIDGSKITIQKGKKDNNAEVTLTADAKVKVSKGKFNQDTKKLEAGEALEGGLKNEAVKVDAKATFITDDTSGKITSIIMGGGKKKAQ